MQSEFQIDFHFKNQEHIFIQNTETESFKANDHYILERCSGAYIDNFVKLQDNFSF